MPDEAVSALGAMSQVDVTADSFEIVDNSDHTMAGTGTNKRALADFVRFAVMGDISGLGITRTPATTDSITIAAGKIGVNGKLVTQASAAAYSFTSGTRAKTIAGANITAAALKKYWIYISDAGVHAFEDATSGDAPVWDATLGYWKATTGGTLWRRIGACYTNRSGSGALVDMVTSGLGRERRFIFKGYSSAGTAAQDNQIRILNGVVGTGSSFINVPITPFITADDESYEVELLTTDTAGTQVFVSPDGGASVRGELTASTTVGPPGQRGHAFIPNTGTLHYSNTEATSTLYIDITGVAMFV